MPSLHVYHVFPRGWIISCCKWTTLRAIIQITVQIQTFVWHFKYYRDCQKVTHLVKGIVLPRLCVEQITFNVELSRAIKHKHHESVTAGTSGDALSCQVLLEVQARLEIRHQSNHSRGCITWSLKVWPQHVFPHNEAPTSRADRHNRWKG